MITPRRKQLADDVRGLQVFVRDGEGGIVAVDLHSDADIRVLRTEINKLDQFSAVVDEDLIIKYAGETLSNGNAMLSDLGITAESFLDVSVETKVSFDLTNYEDLKALELMFRSNSIREFEMLMISELGTRTILKNGKVGRFCHCCNQHGRVFRLTASIAGRFISDNGEIEICDHVPKTVKGLHHL